MSENNNEPICKGCNDKWSDPESGCDRCEA